MQPFNMWAALDTAQVGGASGDNNFEPDFDGDVQPERIRMSNSQDGRVFFNVDCRVLVSNHEAHPVGATATFSQKMTGVQAAMKGVKEFMCACLGVSLEDAATIKMLEGPANPAQPGSGSYFQAYMGEAMANGTQNTLIKRPLHVRTQLKQKKTGPGVWLKYTWGQATGVAGAPAKKQASPQAMAPMAMYPVPQAPGANGALPLAPLQPPQFPPQAPPFAGPPPPAQPAPQPWAPPGANFAPPAHPQLGLQPAAPPQYAPQAPQMPPPVHMQPNQPGQPWTPPGVPPGVPGGPPTGWRPPGT